MGARKYRDQEIVDIRAKLHAGMTTRELSREYKTTLETIQRIGRGDTYRDIGNAGKKIVVFDEKAEASPEDLVAADGSLAKFIGEQAQMLQLRVKATEMSPELAKQVLANGGERALRANGLVVPEVEGKSEARKMAEDAGLPMEEADDGGMGCAF